MRIILIIMALIATGCGKDSIPAIEWSGEVTEQSERFILTHDMGRTRLPQVELAWIRVQTCTGISIDISDRPLTIEYTNPEDIPDDLYGKIVYSDSYTRIRKSDFSRNAKTTRHEMLHYIIYLVEGTTKQSAHDHIFWEQCRF